MRYWRTELKRLLLLGGAALLAGLLAGEVTLLLLLALAGYSLLHLRQLRRLQKWLDREPTAPLPETGGLWGGIFDGIHRLQRQERRDRQRLSRIVGRAQKSSAALKWGIVMTDRHGKLDWWNEAASRLLGLRHPQDRRQSLTNLLRDPRFAAYFEGGDYDEALQLEGGGGRILEFQAAVFGEQERLLIVRDISRLHRLERMRKDFVGNVSHELGTPITVIKGYLEAMQEAMGDGPEAPGEPQATDGEGHGALQQWRHPLQQMAQQARRMEDIVRDLLLLSALETRGPPSRQEEILLAELFDEIRQDSAPQFADKSHHLRVDCAPSLRLQGSRSEIYSAVSNLLANAAKYTPPGGHISLSATVVEAGIGGDAGTSAGGGGGAGAGGDGGGLPVGDGSLHITVEDDGIGIEARHLPRLTERFYRVDPNRAAESGGTGLGLAIVKHILTRHEGRLQIKSTPGHGSRFTAILPPTRLLP